VDFICNSAHLTPNDLKKSVFYTVPEPDRPMKKIQVKLN